LIEVKDKSREMPLVLLAIESSERDVPDYMEVNHKKLAGTFLRT
ncbi:MAG TPA: 30S ribosomal protein S4, partial [Rhodospirillaceae bacterium]|nr:30S ribosomal protein S4 [Rhodospirillaceae bacterium]